MRVEKRQRQQRSRVADLRSDFEYSSRGSGMVKGKHKVPPLRFAPVGMTGLNEWVSQTMLRTVVPASLKEVHTYRI
jgi:hypothetical protein